MEKKLHRLFDYQKFQRNTRLEAMLAEAEGRYDRGVSDDDLEQVNAAGEGFLMNHFFPAELLEGNSTACDQASVPVMNLPPEERL